MEISISSPRVRGREDFSSLTFGLGICRNQKPRGGVGGEEIECLAKAQPSFNLGVFYHAKNRLRTMNLAREHFLVGISVWGHVLLFLNG